MIFGQINFLEYAKTRKHSELQAINLITHISLSICLNNLYFSLFMFLRFVS